MNPTLALLTALAAVLATGAPGPLDDVRPADVPGGRDEACAVLPRGGLRIGLAIEPDVPQDLRAGVVAIVTDVWRREGLAIEWELSGGSHPVERSTYLGLRLTTRHLGHPASGEPALGVVRFIGDLPVPDVLVSWTAVLEWARRERLLERRWPLNAVSRDPAFDFGHIGLARRAAAYAAAHEVGHFVLGMKGHDRAGLMQSRLLPKVLATADDLGPPLSAASRRRLRDRQVRGAACALAETAS